MVFFSLMFAVQTKSRNKTSSRTANRVADSFKYLKQNKLVLSLGFGPRPALRV
jgi:hypothetical protein